MLSRGLEPIHVQWPPSNSPGHVCASGLIGKGSRLAGVHSHAAIRATPAGRYRIWRAASKVLGGRRGLLPVASLQNRT